MVKMSGLHSRPRKNIFNRGILALDLQVCEARLRVELMR